MVKIGTKELDRREKPGEVCG